MKNETGGPAFPSVDNDPRSQHYTQGMDLRDYFAGQAMAQLIAHKEAIMADNPDLRDSGADVEAAVAKAAYLQADAMIAERSK